MKKAILIILILVGVTGLAVWQYERSHGEVSAVRYQCPMHPQIVSDNPGNCPICGMTLVPMKGEEPEHKDPEGALYISPQRRQLIGVTTAEVVQKPLQQEVRLPGRIAFDKELYVTESEYVEALKFGNEGDVLEAIQSKMQRLGISAGELQNLKKTKKVDASLFMPKENGPFWVYASLYESDLKSTAIGMKASIQIPYDKSISWEGEVKQVTPILETNTRTATVRIFVASGENGSVKPETFVDVVLKKDLGNVLAVPADAVIDTGTRQIVFVDLGEGYLSPREVRVGSKAGNDYQIISGLEAGEKVVTAANFLVDSESQLKAVMAGMQH